MGRFSWQSESYKPLTKELIHLSVHGVLEIQISSATVPSLPVKFVH